MKKIHNNNFESGAAVIFHLFTIRAREFFFFVVLKMFHVIYSANNFNFQSFFHCLNMLVMIMHGNQLFHLGKLTLSHPMNRCLLIIYFDSIQYNTMRYFRCIIK